MKKLPKIEIRKSKRNGQFRFVVIAANGEPLAMSESYTTKAKCKTGINATVDALAVGAVVDTTA
jgi:uncharacterized protein YegP (UPF0339 family)